MGRRAIRREIKIRGVTYLSVPEAAKAHRVSPQTVAGAMRRGRLDFVGLGSGFKPRMPVRIGGKDYPDGYAAAADIGVAPSTVWQAINDGDPDRVLRGHKGRVAPNRKAIEIGPLVFPSYAAAGQSLGVSKSYISQALRLGSPKMKERLVAAAMRLAAQQERKAA